MNTKRRLSFAALITFTAALFVLGGCGVDRSIAGNLDVSYVSGHLGSSYACSASSGGAARLAPGEAGDAAGACAPGYPCGGGCEKGSVTLRLANVGNIALGGLDVGQLVLNAVGGGDSNLTIVDVKRDDGATFDGKLEPGASVSIRVRFPAPGYSAVPKGATIDITVITGGGKEQKVTTPELRVLPSVAT